MHFEDIVSELKNLRCYRGRVWISLAVWTCCISILATVIGSHIHELSICVIFFFLCTGWGHVLLFPLFYKNRKTFEGFVFGTATGVALSSYLISLIVYSKSWNLPIIIPFVFILPWGLFLYLMKRRRQTPLNGLLSEDLDLYFAFLALVTLFFYLPYKNLGSIVGDNHVFAWLFGHDFINRLVHSVSLSQGLPLKSFHFAGENLSYYWLSYVFPSFLYRIDIPLFKMNMIDIMKITSFVYSVILFSAVFLFMRSFKIGRITFLIILSMVFIAGSYTGIYNLFIYGFNYFWGEGDLIIGGLRINHLAGFSHSLYRTFLVEPQANLGISVMLSILLIFKDSLGASGRYYTYGILGLLLGVLFGVEATLGLMLAFWFCCSGLYMLLRDRTNRIQVFKLFSISILICLVVYLSLFYIEMYRFNVGKGALLLTLNLFPIVAGILYFPFAYGPNLLIGLAGLLQGLRRKTGDPQGIDIRWFHMTLILFLIALFFTFFVKNPTEPQFGLLKAERIIPICLLIFSLNFLLRERSRRSLTWVILLIAIGAPTYATDLMVSSNLVNPRNTYLARSDSEACQWIRENLSADAIVQAEPNHPGEDSRFKPLYYYSLIPIFAERPTAIGEWKVSSQEHAKPSEVSERFHAVRRMFSTDRVDEALSVIRRYKIDYIYIGRLEKKSYPRGVGKFSANPNLFRSVYSNRGTEIYDVRSRP